MQTARTISRSRHTISAAAATLLMVAVLVAPTAPAASFDGAGPLERTAIRVRVLQSDMMVAALSCDLRPQYNDAVRRFQAELVLHGRHLRGYFTRAHGKRGQRELDRFVTALANQASSRSIAQGSRYCDSASNMMAQILELPPNGLAEFSRRVVDLANLPRTNPVATAARPTN